MRLRLTPPLLAAAVLLVPGLALATDLITEGGFKFDLQDGVAPAFGHDGTFSDGLNDAYDGAYGVTINGTMYSPTGTPTTSLGGRQIEMPEQTIGTLTVRRLVYVPSTGGNFARILDLITNTGAAATTVTAAYYINLGSDGVETISDTSSGDATCDTTDDWCESGVTTGSFMMDPTLGTVFQGPGATVRATSMALGSGESRWSFSVPIAAGARVGLLTFAIQETNGMPTLIRPEATRLVALPDDVMVGMDDYLGDLVNFQGDTPGAPRIRFSGPANANEGDGFDVTVAITDMAGITPTWTWDLDGDGTFGDMPGATSYSVPSGTTDGPAGLRIGVQATNGTVMSQRYRTVSIANLPPTVLPPLPPGTTSDGANYTFQIMASDPAAAADPLTYACTTCPGTMTVSPGGFVSWTPGDLDVTMPLMPDHVTVTVDDGDMGHTTVDWDLTVLANHPPSRPSAIYPSGLAVANLTPRFAAGNSTDIDGDALDYFFEIDDVDTFDSPDKITSPGVPQTDGFTAFRPTTPLMPGLQYFWRVRANDTMADSEWAMTSFYTGGTPVARDAGVVDGSAGDGGGATDAGHHVTPPGRGGCCTTAPGAPGGGALLVVGIVALVSWRRRRAF